MELFFLLIKKDKVNSAVLWYLITVAEVNIYKYTIDHIVNTLNRRSAYFLPDQRNFKLLLLTIT